MVDEKDRRDVLVYSGQTGQLHGAGELAARRGRGLLSVDVVDAIGIELAEIRPLIVGIAVGRHWQT